ncbi:MAG: PEP-CTERM sorting domain-containing protein, partial [Acidobacteriota bacterium]
NGGSTPPEINDFNVSSNGVPLLSLVGANLSSYSQYTFHFTGTGSDTLQFGGRNDNNYFALDDVSVQTALPEPSGVLLLGTGMVAMLGLWARRRGLVAVRAGR